MGDAGEGLVDNEARAQERRDELERARQERRVVVDDSPEARQRRRDVESLRLARAELQRQFDATTVERRRSQISAALDELDRRLAALTGP
jgi:hypothetical protein